jgi:hypothetical protein
MPFYQVNYIIQRQPINKKHYLKFKDLDCGIIGTSEIYQIESYMVPGITSAMKNGTG